MIFNTSLFDETTFYTQFIKDLNSANHEVIIESPFIGMERMNTLMPIIERSISLGVKLYIITRAPEKHTGIMRRHAEEVISHLERLGVQVLVASNNHHRKLAIIDRKILWEGSLNILSQSYSREIMRRIQGNNHAQEMFNFLQLGSFI